MPAEFWALNSVSGLALLCGYLALGCYEKRTGVVKRDDDAVDVELPDDWPSIAIDQHN